MIQIAHHINLDTIEDDIIVAYRPDHPLFFVLNQCCNNGLSSIKETIAVPTLGHMKAKKIYLYLGENLVEDFASIAKLEGNYIVLIDTFAEKDHLLETISLFGEVITQNNYRFEELKSQVKPSNKKFKIITQETKGKQFLDKGVVVGEAYNICKKLVDTPNNYLNAQALAKHALSLQEKIPSLQVSVQGKEQIQLLKMGAFLGVNQGSVDEPQLIELSYQGGKPDQQPLWLIGKGLTFDTGGYTLKENMVNMKTDMAGAAAVLGAMEAIARLNLKVNVNGLILATDNRIDAKAIVPDDVLTSMSGKTIEIVSTDAEGRLTLADALTYAQSKGAQHLVDVATLTGSMANTFGKYYTGVYSNDDSFYDQLLSASKKAKEPIWRMPLDEQYFEGIKSNVADMKNSGPRVAGANVAAIFLQQFVKKDSKWIHIDIAGTSSNDGKGTGIMVKTFIELAKNFQ